jgi:hypothetical protein
MTTDAHALLQRKCIATPIALSPLTRHFLKTTAKQLGISVAEFVRRVLDLTLIEYLKVGLYRLPAELTPCVSDPIERPQQYDLVDFAKLKTSRAKRGGASANSR